MGDKQVDRPPSGGPVDMIPDRTHLCGKPIWVRNNYKVSQIGNCGSGPVQSTFKNCYNVVFKLDFQTFLNFGVKKAAPLFMMPPRSQLIMQGAF